MGRKTRARAFIWMLVVLATSALLLPARAVQATPEPPAPFQDAPSRFFEATRHYVRGPFLEFFETRGGVDIFGYPLTRAFYDNQSGFYVQYFGTARMEWHPENDEPYRVQLSLLGDLLGHSQPPLPRSEWPSNSQYRHVFPETGHTVSFAFLSFFVDHGGLDVFGYPISEPLVENGRIVQYFQRMRMEWHPARPRDERVVLGTLGNEYMIHVQVSPEHQRPESPDNIAGAPARYTPAVADSAPLRVWAAVRHAVTEGGDTQTVFAYVTGAAREPRAGAHVTVTVRYPSGAVTYELPDTDQRGITQVTFPIQFAPPGRRVVVQVDVENHGLTGTAQTFFTPWP
jgi:hypothetical protein